MGKGGFTLIELLIVIAVIGVLAAIVLVAIDPIQQLARGRDSGRMSSISQMGRAVEAYATTHDGEYPEVGVDVTSNAGESFLDILIAAGEIKQAPPAVNYTDPGDECSGVAGNTGTVVNGWCYNATADEMVVYTVLESNSMYEQAGCDEGTNEINYFVWHSNEGAAGFVCAADESNLL